MPPATIDEIISRAKTYLPNLDEGKVRRAFSFANEAHAGQTRFSGEPYIIHPLSVAAILLDFHPDESTIIAALLHDVAEDTDRTLENIEERFGAEVKNLCWGMLKLSKVRSRLNDPQTENLRKLFLAMAKDFRVVLLKLCDRLHNMRTLEHVRPEKRIRIAQETINIYAPIAARLGIYRLKSQLEDLCFYHLHPEEWKNIQDQLVKTEKWRERYIVEVRRILVDILSREGLHGHVDGRVKSSYSIYRKLQKKGKTSLDDIFDVFAMRVVLPDIFKYGKEYVGHVYTALGIIHNNFTPLANRFKDYVAVPKVNGYRSLHTTVMGLGPKLHTQPTEVQIRTTSMHESSEFGIAAHWLYDEHKLSQSGLVSAESAAATHMAPFIRRQKEWISALHSIEREIKSNQEFLENLRVDVFQDRIFVLTPRGDVKDLPAGATPVDFAYALHTEIGNRCIGAKVNGAMASLDTELKSGEVVEIVTRKNALPSQQWLTFVKTNHARNRIRGFFRDISDENFLRIGRDLLNNKLTQLGLPQLSPDLSLLREYQSERLTRQEREDVLKEIGKGAISASAVLRKIFSLEELLDGRNRLRRKDIQPVPTKFFAASEPPRLLIGGEKNLPHHFVACCEAGFEDDLVGYVTRGRGVSIHKRDCSVMRNAERERQVSVGLTKTGDAAGMRYPVMVRIDGDDRVGFVRDVSGVIAENGVNILHITQLERTSEFTSLVFSIEVKDFDQFDRVLSKLEKIPSVRRASRVNSGSS